MNNTENGTQQDSKTHQTMKISQLESRNTSKMGVGEKL